MNGDTNGDHVNGASFGETDDSNIVPILPMAEVESDGGESIFDEDRLERRESNPGEEVEEKGISFQPPLYVQRYDKALDILLEERWVHAINRVVDFGCAECKLVVNMKRLPYVHEIVGVDIDQYLLVDCQRRTEPLFFDYIEPRPFTPIDLYLMNGSVAEPDSRLAGVDAVTAIELIEHLEPEILSKFPETIFGFIRPKLAIVTTPNQEFNIRFDSFEGPFRHWDHKFEWTRKEFENWASNIIDNYPDYKVSFFGIGAQPEDDQDTGDCSQGALFIRKDFEMQANNGELLEEIDNSNRTFVSSFPVNDVSETFPYKIVVHHKFPFRRDDRPFEEKVLFEAVKLINSFGWSSDEWLERLPAKLRLDFMANHSTLQKYDVTTEQLSEILRANSYEIEVEVEDGENFEVVVIPYASDGYPSSDEHEFDEAESPPEYARAQVEEDDENWD